MSVLTVVAKVVAKRECIDATRKELLKLVAPTRKEDGCIEYRLHQDNDDPAVFVFYENWQSEACLLSHMNSDHFKAYIAAVDDMIEDKVVFKMTGIE